ncbi:MAG: fused MFS/spermidine synthase [Candidatus Taylorbacteria bacterium]|nr:fused MFS/spermidine synthase [Candidatus Taylorbacteria bacterium]
MRSTVYRYRLEFIVFVCGAVVMIFELLGSRVIGPYVGTSTYAWTSLIGVILASLSIGYYVGGAVADKKPETNTLALIILLSAVCIAITVFAKDLVSSSIVVTAMTIEVKALLISLILFSPASFLLGMVSPFAVRLRLELVEKAGRTAGNLYAISTAGSIFGTFLAGFYVIPNFGTTNSLAAISIVLVVLSLILFMPRFGRAQAVLILPMLIFLGLAYSAVKPLSLVADIDTEYNRIWIFETADRLTGKSIRALSMDPYGIQAAVFSDGSADLVFSYTKFYDLSNIFVPNPKSALFIGGSVYTYPRHFIKNNPEAEADVVEIDPGMTNAAKKYFRLPDDPPFNIYHEDGRLYLNNNEKKYDLIFGDAFNSASSVPFQLTTREAVGKMYDSLNDGGAVLVNLISAIEGEKGKFLRAEYHTYKEFFPQVYIFPINDFVDRSLRQNVMLVALKTDKVPDWNSVPPQFAEKATRLWTARIERDVAILTDDHAPVESYMRDSL